LISITRQVDLAMFVCPSVYPTVCPLVRLKFFSGSKLVIVRTSRTGSSTSTIRYPLLS